MSHNVYDIGTVVTLTAVFKDPKTKAVVQPEHVTCTVIDGKDQTTTPAVTNNGGTYEAQVDVEAKGKGEWLYAFAGTGGYKARAESWFEVRPQMVP